MGTITFQPDETTLVVPSGTDLLSAARRAGVEIHAPCGGKGTCGKCIVRVISGQVDSDSFGMLPPSMAADGYVLACKTKLLDGPVTIEVPAMAAATGGQFGEEDETYLVRRELLPRESHFDPLAVKWRFQVPSAQQDDGLGDLDRMIRTVQSQWGKVEVQVPLAVLQTLASALREQDGLVTATIIREGAKLHLTRVEPGDCTTRNFGIAVDIGTTTVAVQLINLTTGALLATRTAYNGQIPCGLDIISRINYAQTPERLDELRSRICETINELIAQLIGPHYIDPDEICNAVVSGNTTMIHLLLALPPEHIRLDPYTPTLLEVPYLSAEKVGLHINPHSWVCFSPNVGSYIGGDITAGLLCSDLATDTEEVSLFIDIGTNGEIVLGNCDFLLSCACSAGPAFEGGGIDCGMRASAGAIEKVDIDPVTGEIIDRRHPLSGACLTGRVLVLPHGRVDPAHHHWYTAAAELGGQLVGARGLRGERSDPHQVGKRQDRVVWCFDVLDYSANTC